MRGRRREDPSRYLEQALTLMRRHALVRDAVDWAELLPRVWQLAAGARTVADTHPAIRAAVDELQRFDRHSFFLPPGRRPRWYSGLGLAVLFPESIVAIVTADGPAARAGVRPGDHLLAVDGQPPRMHARSSRLAHLLDECEAAVRLTLLRRDQPYDVALTPSDLPAERPTADRVSETVGYLALQGLAGAHYGREIRRVRRRIEPVQAWIVDLRRHTGGNMWPALAGLRPILGPGEAGAFVDANGAVMQRWGGRRTRRKRVPVAVLQGPLTGSTGEALIISFRGRPRTRTFGEATYGLPTANQPFSLSDGAQLLLTTAREADRTGRVYDGPIEPDEHVTIDWAALGTPDDQVLVAALEWLPGP